MRWPIFLAAALLCSCASQRLPNSQTASEQFSRLGYSQKGIAKKFYELGQGDAIKRLYWAQRDSQERNTGISDAPPPVSLQRKYVNIWLPPQVQPDGTEKEGHYQAIEVVQLWEAIPLKNWGTLHLVR